jgi:predicted DCC family thiol-disulfide oxidoreductase YuxK
MVPTLIYDGHCGFCKIWVNYWRRLTGDRVLYSSSQSAGPQYPQISPDDFKRSVWLVYPDGARFSGAQAVFRLMSQGGGSDWPLVAYQRIPGVAAVAEAAYNFVAGHRELFYWVTRIFWGKTIEPPSHRWSRAMLLHGLALVYFLAFAALLPQILGLIGQRGILPAGEYLQDISSQIGSARYAMFPTLTWLNSSDGLLSGMCWAGIALSAVLLFRVAPAAAVPALYVLYLSIDTVGQTFLSFQWDALLLEAGFAAILLAPRGWRPRYATEPRRIGIWVMRFLVFRLMLESGMVKLLSGDPTWRNLTALNFHYETQPLPTPLGWYAHQMSPGVQAASVFAVFVLELAVPFLFLMPRLPRIAGAWATIVFQLIIAATGNYTFFNLLAIVLGFSLFDDQHLRRFVPLRLRRPARSRTPTPKRGGLSAALAVVTGSTVIGVGLLQLVTMVGVPRTLPPPVASVVEYARIYHVANRYGLFAVMTTARPEIVLEGSNDGMTWEVYEFKFKPGDVNQAPQWIAPYHPRLDWQMWFAALSNYRDNPWFSRFMIRILEGSPEVLDLLAHNPFPGKPPRLVRAVVYDYHFSDSTTLRITGAWWTRRPLGVYFPAVSLR